MAKVPTAASEGRNLRFKNLLDSFSQAARDKYGSYSYEAGYLESMARAMFSTMTKTEQEYWIKIMADHRLLKDEA